MGWRAAYEWQRRDAAVPWANRIALAVGFDAVFVVAGWGRPWWELALACAPFPMLVAFGIAEDVRSE